jgi:dihydroneopterin aldolase
MADKLFIQGLAVRCIIGTLPRERKRKQKVVIDLEFPVSVRKAAAKDKLCDAVNYKEIAERATAFVASSRFFLIETLAKRLAAILLREFPIPKISIRISKPEAIRNAEGVGVWIERRKKNLKGPKRRI